MEAGRKREWTEGLVSSLARLCAASDSGAVEPGTGKGDRRRMALIHNNYEVIRYECFRYEVQSIYCSVQQVKAP